MPLLILNFTFWHDRNKRVGIAFGALKQLGGGLHTACQQPGGQECESGFNAGLLWFKPDMGGVLDPKICRVGRPQGFALKPEVLENDIAHFIARAEAHNIRARQPVAGDLDVLEQHVPNGTPRPGTLRPQHLLPSITLRHLSGRIVAKILERAVDAVLGESDLQSQELVTTILDADVFEADIFDRTEIVIVDTQRRPLFLFDDVAIGK